MSVPTLATADMLGRIHYARAQLSASAATVTTALVSTELIKDTALVGATPELKSCYMALNVPVGEAEQGNYTVNESFPLGFMVPWCWAVQEFLPNTTPASQQRDVWGDRPIMHISELFGGNISWDVPHSELRPVSEASLLNAKPRDGQKIVAALAAIRTHAFSPAAVLEDLEFVGSELVKARHSVIGSARTTTLAGAYGILNVVAARVATILSEIGLATPEDVLHNTEGPREATAIIIGGGILVTDLARIFRELAQRRLQRLEAAAANSKTTLPDGTLYDWVVHPLLASLAIPLPIVEIGQYQQQQQANKPVVADLRALKVVQKSLLNPHPEGDRRSLVDRMAALSALLAINNPSHQIGQKRSRDESSDVVAYTKEDITMVSCQITSRNPMHATKAAAVAAAYIDSFELNVTAQVGSSTIVPVDNASATELIATMPLLIGRMVRGIDDGANGEETTARRLSTVAYYRRVATCLFPGVTLDVEGLTSVGDFAVYSPISLHVGIPDNMEVDTIVDKLVVVVAASNGKDRVGKETAPPPSTASAIVPSLISITNVSKSTVDAVSEKMTTVKSVDVHVPSGKRVDVGSVVGTMAEAIYQVSLNKDDKAAKIVIDYNTAVKSNTPLSCTGIKVNVAI
jgi:hypothetical protein